MLVYPLSQVWSDLRGAVEGLWGMKFLILVYLQLVLEFLA